MKVEHIKVIKVGEEDIKVEDTSPQVQQMVAVYNEWRQVAGDHKSSLTMAEMALRSLGADIQTTILKEREVADDAVSETADDKV